MIKHSTRKRWRMHLAWLLLIGPVWGHAAPLPDPLTLESALRLADHASPEIDAAQARLAEGEADKTIARSALLPRLGIEGRIAAVQPALASPTGERDWTNDNLASLVLRQRLLDFGRGTQAMAASRHRIEARGAELMDLRNKRRIEVMSRFFDVLLADRRKDVTNEAMAVAFVRFRDGREFKALGQISELELARLEDVFRATRSAYVEAENRQRDTRLRLATALGVTDQIPSKLETPPNIKFPKLDVEFDELYKQALAQNPLLKASKAELEAADADYRMARRNVLPNIDAEARANYYTRQFGIRDRYFLGILIDWPLYQGGGQQGTQDKFMARRIQAQAHLDQQRLNLREAVMDTMLDINTQEERLREAEARIRYRNKGLDLGRSMYELELKTDLGNTMVEHTDAELFNARVHYQLILAWARLNALLGKSVTMKDIVSAAPKKESANEK